MNNTREITLEYAKKNYQLYPDYYLRDSSGQVHFGSFCVNNDGYVQLVRGICYKGKDHSINDLRETLNRFIDNCEYCIRNHKPVNNIADGVSGIKIWNEKIIDWGK